MSRGSQQPFKEFDRQLAALPTPRSLVFVRYALDHDPHISLVRNVADPTNAPVIVALDLGPSSRAAVRAGFPLRRAYIWDESNGVLVKMCHDRSIARDTRTDRADGAGAGVSDGARDTRAPLGAVPLRRPSPPGGASARSGLRCRLWQRDARGCTRCRVGVGVMSPSRRSVTRERTTATRASYSGAATMQRGCDQGRLTGLFRLKRSSIQ